MYPFERFSEDGKRTLTLAQEEAERSGHSYIGTEHLLLGLMRIESGAAYRVLTELGVAIEPVRDLIKSVLGRNERILNQSIIPTSRVKAVIEISFEEARRMGHNSVDTGHLLMGLVIEGEGIAAHVLQDLGATAERVIAEVEREMGVEPGARGKRRKSRRLRFSFPGRVPSGLPSTVIAGHTFMPMTSDVQTLHRLLRVPHIARLLRTRGVDVDALSTHLLQPPGPVAALRQELYELRAAIGAQTYEKAAKLQKREIELLKKLEKAEREWLDSLG